MKKGLKQLLRTPARTALFFLLMAAATLLLVFSSCLLSETSQRIDEVESSFTTIARVEQIPALSGVPETWYNECWGKMISETDVWDDLVTMEDLKFEGANYLTEPEYRPYYMTEHPEWNHTIEVDYWDYVHIIEFTPLEDGDELGAAYVRAEKVLLQQPRDVDMAVGLFPPREGTELFFCQCGGTANGAEGTMIPLEKGKRYIATIAPSYYCQYHDVFDESTSQYLEYMVYPAPYTTQYDAEGNEIIGDHFPYLSDGTQNRFRVEEVTEDFYEEGGRGQDWLAWAEFITQKPNYFPVMPVGSLQILPVFQEYRAQLAQGREITKEEYDSGALVCMVPEDTLWANLWNVGDKLSLPLSCSLYGPNTTMRFHYMGALLPSYNDVVYNFSPFRADGSMYEPFWSAEYEIVGTYKLVQSGSVYLDGEIYPDTILIPKNSVGVSDENNIAYYNYLDGKTATFQIENGTIDDFDAALRANVPQAESLLITYNDNGYTEIMETLQSTRSAAQLLFAVGLLAAIAIILLLLYFFIVKEKKRTAIERSLGMTKRQCRVSLLSGILALTVLASCLGALGGAAAMEVFHRQEQAAAEAASEENLTEEDLAEESSLEEISEIDAGEENAEDVLLNPGEYNPKYSSWAKNVRARQTVDLNVRTPVFVYGLVPFALVLLVFVLSLLLINRNLKIDPIYLLSSKTET